MKTVITASGNNLTSQFDSRFGRAGWFCLYDEETKELEFHINDSLNASNGAGIKAAEKMVELNVRKVISGDFGPKAKDLLDKFNIQMVVIKDDDITIENILLQLK